jgi:2-keto-4-pentenoate hydratase/2-oxohepta-3-ene-1,7-dioic acid hydratase in catechol pathway
MQKRFREQGLPWELSKGFDGSAVVGDFMTLDRLPEIQSLHFGLKIDGEWAQQGCTSDMLFKVDELIAYVSRFYTLKTGDLLYTGTPSGVGPVSVGQHLEGYLEDYKVLEFNVR